jgi:hypothetical protein
MNRLRRAAPRVLNKRQATTVARASRAAGRGQSDQRAARADIAHARRMLSHDRAGWRRGGCGSVRRRVRSHLARYPDAAPRWFRSRRAHPRRGRASAAAPIVALTADAGDEERAQAAKAGMDDFITKPIDANRLLQVAARFTERPNPATFAGK